MHYLNFKIMKMNLTYIDLYIFNFIMEVSREWILGLLEVWKPYVTTSLEDD